MNVIHRATEAVYPNYYSPDVLSLQMLSEAELRKLQHEAGLENLDVLIKANHEHRPGAAVEHLPEVAQEQVTRLAAVLERHPEMLSDRKCMMRQQL